MKNSEKILFENGKPITEYQKQYSEIEQSVILELKKALNELMIKIDAKLEKLNPKKLEDYGYHSYYTGMKACVQMILDTSSGKVVESDDKGEN